MDIEQFEKARFIIDKIKRVTHEKDMVQKIGIEIKSLDHILELSEDTINKIKDLVFMEITNKFDDLQRELDSI